MEPTRCPDSVIFRWRETLAKEPAPVNVPEGDQCREATMSGEHLIRGYVVGPRQGCPMRRWAFSIASLSRYQSALEELSADRGREDLEVLTAGASSPIRTASATSQLRKVTPSAGCASLGWW
jgi:hypothetical protein